MNLLDSLLDAIVRLEGDALVMHVGEKPYVVTTTEGGHQFRGPLAWGQVELSSRVLTTDAVSGMLGQILPLDQRSALDEYGATDYEVTSAIDADQRFTIVAARGGDDIWLEVRRQPKPAVESVAAPVEPSLSAEPPVAATVETPVPAAPVAADAVVIHAETAAAPVQPEAPVEISPLPVPLPSHEVEALAQAVVAESPAPEVTVLHEDPELEILDAPDTVEETVYADAAGGEFESEEELEIGTDREIEAGILAASQEWDDEVMTEGDLGELLRGTAAAVITGEGQTEDAASLVDQPFTIDLTEELEPEPAVVTEELEPEPAVVAEEPEPAVFVEHSPVMESARAPVIRELTMRRATEELAVLVEYQLDQEREASLSRAMRDPLADPSPVISESAADPIDEVLAPVAEYELNLDQETDEVPIVEGSSDPGQLAQLIEQTDLSVAESEVVLETRMEVEPALIELAAAEPASVVEEVAESVASGAEAEPEVLAPAAAAMVEGPVLVSGAGRTAAGDYAEQGAPVRQPAVILPLTRQPRLDATGDSRAPVATTLQRLLRLGGARGAATVYVVAQTAPMVRIDGEFSALEGEPPLTAAFVERLLAEVAPSPRDSAAPAAEWLIDVPEIGRVRCVSFRDHRGPGVIFRIVPPRAISADQLGLSAEVQALCAEADGLVLVTGGRGSGKSTLLTSFVDLINRTRSDHIITAESQIDFVHENKRSFVSQREVRGDDAVVAAVRAACREEPDVLIIEDIRTQELAALAFEAAEAGRLVFASVPGVSTATAIERLIELFPAERREKAQATLAATLRGMVSQVLLRKLRGGQVAAREVLINTPAVANLILEGKTFQLPASLESGRRAGMTSFAESLAALVREGTVHPSHAFRKAPNREQFLALLRRDGVDASIAERPA